MQNPLAGLLRYLLLPLLLFACLASVTILLTRWWMQTQAIRLDRIQGSDAIDRLEALEIGGIKQWILMRGPKKAPLLVWLHGGPGGPSNLAFARAMDEGLVKHFLVVHWDQRGTGKSFSPAIPRESMNLKQLLADLRALIGYLKTRFQVPKVILLGHQWGSVLGLSYAQAYPGDLLAWIGIAQVVDWEKQELQTYRAVLEQAKRATQKEAITEVEHLGLPPYSAEKADVLKKWAAAYQGVYFRTPNLSGLLKASLGSPDYTLAELFRFSQGVRFSQETLRSEAIQKARFFPPKPLEMPAFFFQGRHDLLTGGEIFERYIRELKAPHKEVVWFEASSHYPEMEERGAFEEALVKKVLPAIQAQARSFPSSLSSPASQPQSPASRPSLRAQPQPPASRPYPQAQPQPPASRPHF